jgi:hypothetical protein
MNYALSHSFVSMCMCLVSMHTDDRQDLYFGCFVYEVMIKTINFFLDIFILLFYYYPFRDHINNKL